MNDYRVIWRTGEELRIEADYIDVKDGSVVFGHKASNLLLWVIPLDLITKVEQMNGA